jgi:hypothetical protein
VNTEGKGHKDGRILESMCVTDIGQTKLKRRCLSSVRFEWDCGTDIGRTINYVVGST